MPRKGDVVLPERTYRTMRALMKAMARRLRDDGDDLEFAGSELRDVDGLTLEQSFEGEETDWEHATWTLALVDQPPPEKPTVVRREPEVEPEPEPEKEPEAVAEPRKSRWTEDEIVAALLTWRERSDAFPYAAEWRAAGADRPTEQTVRKVFGSWEAAIEAAEKTLAEPEAKADKDAPRLPSSEAALPSGSASVPFEPDWRVAPGETLKEILEERKITEAALSRMTGYRLPVGAVRALLDGTAKLTEKIARELETALGKPTAAFWVALEEGYRKPVKGQPTKGEK